MAGGNSQTLKDCATDTSKYFDLTSVDQIDGFHRDHQAITSELLSGQPRWKLLTSFSTIWACAAMGGGDGDRLCAALLVVAFATKAGPGGEEGPVHRLDVLIFVPVFTRYLRIGVTALFGHLAF